MTQSFTIKPAKPSAIVLLVAIALGCWLLAFVVAISLRSVPVVAWPAAATCVGLGVLFAWFTVAQQWSSVKVIDRQLDVCLPLYSRTFSVNDIVAGSPAKVDLQRDKKFSLVWRTNGLSVPGYQLGWFRSQDARKVLVAMTGTNGVTWTTKGGQSVLLSVADADAFLVALNQATS